MRNETAFGLFGKFCFWLLAPRCIIVALHFILRVVVLLSQYRGMKPYLAPCRLIWNSSLFILIIINNCNWSLIFLYLKYSNRFCFSVFHCFQVLDSEKRIGAKDSVRYTSIRSHSFYESLNFDTLQQQTPPPIYPYLPGTSPDSQELRSQYRVSISVILLICTKLWIHVMLLSIGNSVAVKIIYDKINFDKITNFMELIVAQ